MYFGSDASNFITVPITPNNGTAGQNVSIGLINCQSICNKSDQIADIVKDMDRECSCLYRDLADW